MQRLGIRTALYRALGGVMVALAFAGVFLPVLPTTPFLIVAVWAFARSSPELAERLRDHRRFGPYIRRWEEKRAIPRSAKAASVIGMSVSFALLVAAGRGLWVNAGVGAILLCVAAYVLSRPSQ
ncbi:YbaN family protein [Phenylobacterium immobile]|uniref:YbaN family protein n=1 Tax=Phenylobacterium immobile TaxID=21 RepID=UPI001FE0DC70|nr:YbaN family protein [Phenylobacterium immobile]